MRNWNNLRYKSAFVGWPEFQMERESLQCGPGEQRRHCHTAGNSSAYIRKRVYRAVWYADVWFLFAWYYRRSSHLIKDASSSLTPTDGRFLRTLPSSCWVLRKHVNTTSGQSAKRICLPAEMLGHAGLAKRDCLPIGTALHITRLDQSTA